MKLKLKLAAATSAGVLLFAGTAQAALLNNGFDGSGNTSVFISVVERDAINLPVRTLVVNPGVRSQDVFDLAAWSTSDEVSSVILDFLTSAQGTVAFNIGGSLNDQTFVRPQGFLTSSDTSGPAQDNFAQLGSGIGSIDAKIDNLNRALTLAGGGNTALVLSANDPGWHVFSWNNDVGGAILPSNEVKFGTVAALTGWKTNDDFLIIRSSLGTVLGDAATGRISFTPVPVPAAAWLLVSGFGALAWVRRRPLAA